MLNLNLGGFLDARRPPDNPEKPPPRSSPTRPPPSSSSGQRHPIVDESKAAPATSPSGVEETRSFQPTTKLPPDSMWSRLFRHFTIQSPMIHRFLPKIKGGRLMLEVGDKAEWKQFEVVLAGSSIGDLGLYYYAAKGDTAPVGCISLHSAHVDVLEEVVMVITQDKTWFLCAEHAREASDWAEAICGTIDKVSQGILVSGNVGGLGSGSGKRRRLSSNASSVTLREIQSREPRARVDEFLEIFVRSHREDIRLQAMEGALSWSCMRNLAWKLWLDFLPMDMPFKEWIPSTQIKRHRYEGLRRKHAIFGDLLAGKQADADFIVSCETSEDNLLYAIFKDVRRTRGSIEFFRNSSLQCLLIRVLYTYSNAHPEISYNQGMGELLATIVYLLHIEQWPSQNGIPKSASGNSLALKASNGDILVGRASESSDTEESSYVYVESFIDIQDDTLYLDRDRFLRSTPFCGGSGKYLDCCREAAEEIVQEMTSPVFIEHDAFLLLEEIMFRMAGAYCPEMVNQDPGGLKKRPSFSNLSCGVSMFAAEMAASPLYEQMNSIHHHILSRCDPPTARHLSALGVEPQMFVLRWVRVLMSREFEMAQVWQIWDSIFSLTPSDFSFINLLCVAAVREYREEILQVEDPTAVLLCLRDISEKVDADRLVDNARELYDALLIAAAVEATSEAT